MPGAALLLPHLMPSKEFPYPLNVCYPVLDSCPLPLDFDLVLYACALRRWEFRAEGKNGNKLGYVAVKVGSRLKLRIDTQREGKGDVQVRLLCVAHTRGPMLAHHLPTWERRLRV